MQGLRSLIYFIARNLAWVGVYWLAPKEIQALGDRPVVLLTFPVSTQSVSAVESLHRSGKPDSGMRNLPKTSPIVPLYPGRTRNLGTNR